MPGASKLAVLFLKCFCNAVSLFYGHANQARCCCAIFDMFFPFLAFLFSVRAYNLNFFVVKFCQVTPAANGLFEINYGVVSFGELCCTAL